MMPRAAARAALAPIWTERRGVVKPANFFALGYLGWFVGPVVLILSTALVMATMWRRQFTSDAFHALTHGSAGPPT